VRARQRRSRPRDGDSSVSKSEFAAFKEKLDAMFGAASSASVSSGSSISVTA